MLERLNVGMFERWEKGVKIERFEEIEAWRVARELTRMVYEVTKGEGFRRDFGLRDQVQRAAVSVMSNIAEGFERGSNREFIQFLFYAKGSAGEVRSQLVVALDQGLYHGGAVSNAVQEGSACVEFAGEVYRVSENVRTLER